MSRIESATLLVISLLAAWLGFAMGERSRSSHAQAQAIDAEKAPTPNAVTANVPATSIAARYADLARRAEEGDGAAARELAQALARCAKVDWTQRSLFLTQMWSDSSHRQVYRDEPDQDAMRRLQQRLADTLRENSGACEGVTRAELKSYAHWLYKAGEAGDTASAFEFGSGGFILDDTLGQLEAIPFWRDHAQDMLQRALAQGDARALLPLAEAYDPASSPRWTTGPIFDADPVQAYAYYLAASERNHSLTSGIALRLDRIEATLTDAERAEAQQRAAEICASGAGDICTPLQRH
jgi:hypothetical protein